MLVKTTKRTLCAVIAIAVIWGLVAGMLAHLQLRNAALEATVDSYKERFRQRVGEDEIAGQYHHITLDGGLTWWRCSLSVLPDDSVAVLVDGAADPELVKRLDGLDSD